MKRIFNVLVLIVVAAVFSLNHTARAANDRALFWALKTDNATLYLLGSIHFADASFYPLRPEIEQAFKNSGHLVVEADVLNMDTGRVQELMLQKGMYQGAETLRDHISEDTWRKLLVYIQQSGAPIPEWMLERQKPGMLAITIASLVLVRQGLSPEYGIDLHFLKQAFQSDKTVLELEGVEQQMNMLLDLDLPELLLRQALDQAEDAGKTISTLIRAWKAGDTAEIRKLFIEDPLAEHPDFERLMEKLDFKRNRKMVDELQGYLRQGGRYFVVVGAAHLVGDKGIPALLTEKGYRLERL